ncbi:uncharacterized protein LY89DRAFT_924 [Mollisia scopiformis]|uniref:Uncharacterized protein n=1 Tax=Mollisia scopiformis TaxID=149040 RepID=A0A194XUI1_MOLSC|nr:uncharacterized protein LY89DRAFT_924 [Mollisia scopiformis]KUJ23694.1 hypothetical protein LY89DRAFT_924 [Mollisia scopiformis]
MPRPGMLAALRPSNRRIPGILRRISNDFLEAGSFLGIRCGEEGDRRFLAVPKLFSWIDICPTMLSHVGSERADAFVVSLTIFSSASFSQHFYVQHHNQIEYIPRAISMAVLTAASSCSCHHPYCYAPRDDPSIVHQVLHPKLFSESASQH